MPCGVMLVILMSLTQFTYLCCLLIHLHSSSSEVKSNIFTFCHIYFMAIMMYSIILAHHLALNPVLCPHVHLNAHYVTISVNWFKCWSILTMMHGSIKTHVQTHNNVKCKAVDQNNIVDCIWNVMAHAQKPDSVFHQNEQVHLNQRGRQFSRLLSAEVCASALVMLDTPRSKVMWEYWLPTPFTSFPFTSPPVRHRVPSCFKCSLHQIYLTLYWNIFSYSIKQIWILA